LPTVDWVDETRLFRAPVLSAGFLLWTASTFAEVDQPLWV